MLELPSNQLSDMSNYLTTTAAASTYATKAALSNSITAATIANTDAAQNITVSVSGNGTYSTLSINYANLLTKLNGYLTTASASSTYQTIAGMTSYLTTTAAASTYQTIASMTSYLTTAAAASTYQTIANMTNYLTTTAAASTYLAASTAASTYQTIAGMSSYAALASPTFTGTATAPTINASSTLQVGGANINTIYAPLSIPYIHGDRYSTDHKRIHSATGWWCQHQYNLRASG
jgi:hypothetical protein